MFDAVAVCYGLPCHHLQTDCSVGDHGEHLMQEDVLILESGPQLAQEGYATKQAMHYNQLR